jgi:hypothetical protein
VSRDDGKDVGDNDEPGWIQTNLLAPVVRPATLVRVLGVLGRDWDGFFIVDERSTTAIYLNDVRSLLSV